LVPVAIAVIGMRLRPSTIAFLGWFGPRGLASIILALVVVEAVPQLTGLLQLLLPMSVTVLLSVCAHGITAGTPHTPLRPRHERPWAGRPQLQTVPELPTRRRPHLEPTGGGRDVERALGKKTYELEILGNGFRAWE
jgi:sodium/hydrogen antiporter